MTYTIPNMSDLIALRDRLDAFNVPRCADLDAAATATATVQHSMTSEIALPDRICDLTALQLDSLVTTLAVRHISNATSNAGQRLQNRLTIEARDALVDHVATILDALRPSFDEAAAAVSSAVDLGIRPNMAAEDVIELGSTEAITSWRSLRPHLNALDEIGRLRIRLSELLLLAPQISEAQMATGERVDYTACFVAEESGVRTGYGDGTSPWRWLSLALSTAGRLRLNDPLEVERILHGDGDSPGFIVSAASCVVTDDEARQLMLYRTEWLPSWVDVDQVDRIVDSGLAVAARPDDVRPPDRYPFTEGRSSARGSR